MSTNVKIVNGVKITKYDKLVRDLIPQLIEAKGGKAVVRQLNDDEYKEYLALKLHEEFCEFMAAEDVGHEINELIDLLEVTYALVIHLGYTKDQFHELRLKKMAKAGGFRLRYLLEEVHEPVEKEGNGE